MKLGRLSVGPHHAALKSLTVTKGEVPMLKLVLAVPRGKPEKTMLQFLRDHLTKSVTLRLGVGKKRELVKMRLREFVPDYRRRTVRIETGWGV